LQEVRCLDSAAGGRIAAKKRPEESGDLSAQQVADQVGTPAMQRVGDKSWRD
jgi:hypothetical protein